MCVCMVPYINNGSCVYVKREAIKFPDFRENAPNMARLTRAKVLFGIWAIQSKNSIPNLAGWMEPKQEILSTQPDFESSRMVKLESCPDRRVKYSDGIRGHA